MATDIERHYQSAASLIRVHGILSIIFGSIGIFFSIIMMGLFGLSAGSEYGDYNAASSFIMAFLVFIFGVLPNIYLLISGIHLMRNPSPAVTKTLVIINLVVGVFWNLVILIFAIINLTQIADYEQGYKKVK